MMMTKITPGPFRILVVENDPAQRANLVDILQGWQYEVYIAEVPEGAQDAHQALLDDARHKAHIHRCHLAFVDMRLKDDNELTDTSGLALVSELAPTVSIIRSGHGNVKTVNEALAPEDKHRRDVPLRAYRFIEKSDGPEMLQRVIEDVAHDFWHRREIDFDPAPDFTCDELANKLSELGNKILPDEVGDALQRLFPNAKRLKIEAVNEAQQKRASIPRGHSIVTKVTEDDHITSRIIKLTNVTQDGMQWKDEFDELNRFKKALKYFSGERYASVEGKPAKLWNLAGVVYKFLTGDRKYPIRSFADFYLDNAKASDIELSLRNFLDFWQPVYEKRTQQPKTIFRAYDDAWGGKLSRRLLEFKDSPLIVYPGFITAFRLPNPFQWLAKKIALRENGEYHDGGLPDTQIALCHGDLHSENIFTDTRQDVWLIDYERTGEGPLLQDFTEFENDVLTSLLNLRADEAPLFARLVGKVVDPIDLILPNGQSEFGAHSEASRAYKTIRVWRDLAISVLGASGGDKQQYYYGLLFNAIFRLTLLLREQGEAAFASSTKLAQGTRCLILAGILCHRLDNWTKSWPPEEWKPYLTNRPSVEQEGKPALISLMSTSDPNPSEAYNYALVIGVGNTPSDPRSSLPTTVNDALALQPILVDPMTCAYLPENVRVLNNETATLSSILDELKRLADHTTANPDSTIIVYFSGHGGHLQADDRYFLVPSDIDPTDIEGSVLWASEFTERLRGIKAKRVLVLIDACHAAGMAAVKETSLLRASGFIEAPPPEGLLKSWQRSQPTGSTKQTTSAPPQGEGRAIISSSRGDQSSYIRKDGALSIFTYHLLEALRGEANKTHDTSVSVSTLIGHLGRTVPASAERDWGVQQMPWTDLSGEDFPIVVLQTGGMVESKPARSPSNPILPTTQPSPDQPTHARKNITILHLSDIHLGTTSQAEVYYSQLETDLLHGLEHKQLDYLVLSGDIADKSTESDYQSAQLLVEQLIQRFKLKRNKIILVPGNHDVDYMLSKQAYSRFIHDPIPTADAGKRFIQQSVGRVVCDNEPLYQQRFANFARFYETICQQAYPLLESDQALVRAYASDKLLFLGLNSATEIDHHYESRARINMEALAKGLLKLTAKHDDWLKIAVWHHPIRGPEAMNADFVEQLTMRGFQACMHGHIHEAIEDYHKFDDRRGVRVIGVGTFGAPIRQQTPGIPLQYNLITLSPTDCIVEVQTRKKEKPEGAWSADARWGDKVRDPQPRYAFSVRWGLCSQATIKKG